MRSMALFALAVGILASAGASAATCDGFIDVDAGSTTYCTAVSYVKDRGVTVGCTDTTHYCPNDYVTRLQMALFLQRMGRADPSNTLGDHTTTIGGGTDNTANSDVGSDTVGGGNANAATGGASTVSGGESNSANNGDSTVVGGNSNTASGLDSTVLGGVDNTASGSYSVVLGGTSNQASGLTSVAAGLSANANHDGCFVFADSSDNTITTDCSRANETVFRALGGFKILTAYNSGTSTYSGVEVEPGSGSWTSISDRAVKDAIAPVQPLDVLARVAAMPVATWHYKAQPSGILHMGPMAQDFYAAFGLGETDKGISVVDAQGVALAAIQGLNAKLEARDALISSLAERVRQLTEQMATLQSK